MPMCGSVTTNRQPACSFVRSFVRPTRSDKCTQRYKMTRKLIQNKNKNKKKTIRIVCFTFLLCALFPLPLFTILVSFRFFELMFSCFSSFRFSLLFSTMVFHRDNFSRHSVCSFRLVWLGFYCVTQNFSAKMVGMLFLWFIFNFRWQKMGFMGSDWIKETENRTKLAVYLYNTGKKK